MVHTPENWSVQISELWFMVLVVVGGGGSAGRSDQWDHRVTPHFLPSGPRDGVHVVRAPGIATAARREFDASTGA